MTIYAPNASIFDSDAYGINTDNPASAYEVINDSLKVKDERAITKSIRDFIKELASEYFNTYEWDDEWWDAWEDKFRELL